MSRRTNNLNTHHEVGEAEATRAAATTPKGVNAAAEVVDGADSVVAEEAVEVDEVAERSIISKIELRSGLWRQALTMVGNNIGHKFGRLNKTTVKCNSCYCTDVEA